MQLLSGLQRSLPDFRKDNPHIRTCPLAGIFYFVTYIHMMDDDINDESLILEETIEDELSEEEEDESY